MTVFHGTDFSSAAAITTNVDVTKGGGELGRGFYAGEHIGLASSFAWGKFGANAKVVRLELDDSEFVTLNTRTINRSQYVFKTWKSLLSRKTTMSYVFGADVICAPFATINFSYQYKFESLHSQNVLNGLKTIKTIL